VTLDDTGQDLTKFSPGSLPKPNVWVLNKSGQSQWVSFFGDSTGDAFSVSVRNWYDFSKTGTVVSETSACGFIIRPGEQVMYRSTGKKNYKWNWRPLL